MFYTVKEMQSQPTAQIAHDYEAVLDFVNEVQDVSDGIDEFDLYEVCEADKIYVTAGEKGLEDGESSPRSHGLSKRGAETSSQTSHQFWPSSTGMTDEFHFWSVGIYRVQMNTLLSTAEAAIFSVPTTTQSTMISKTRRGRTAI